MPTLGLHRRTVVRRQHSIVDQIAFIEQLLDLDGLEGRIEHHVRVVVDPRVAPEAERVFFLLREALLRGQFPLGEAARVAGESNRTGCSVQSDSPKPPATRNAGKTAALSR